MDAKILYCVVPGIIVTLGLFLVMHLLIAVDYQPKPEGDIVELAVIEAPNLPEEQPEQDPPPQRPSEEPPAPKYEQPGIETPSIVSNDISGVLVAGLTGTGPGFGPGNLNIQLGGGFLRDRDKIPLYAPPPIYPRKALVRGVDGYALVEMVITTNGSVRDTRLIKEVPKEFGFGKSALKAASKIRFYPKIVDGVAKEVIGVRYKFEFEMAF